MNEFDYEMENDFEEAEQFEIDSMEYFAIKCNQVW